MNVYDTIRYNMQIFNVLLKADYRTTSKTKNWLKWNEKIKQIR